MLRRSIQRENHDGRDLATQRSEDSMATQQTKPTGKTDYVPPPVEGDFYRIAAVLSDSERAMLMGETLTRVYNWSPSKA